MTGGKHRAWPALAVVLVLAAPAPLEANEILSASDDLRALERLARIDGIQCVPYARATSGIQIFGDAWTWWDQAKGRYARGETPRIGAVMAFRPYGHMTLGHVAAVSRIVDNRTVLLRHANWSPIDGRHGQIERDVPAVDVSPANDWSQVRVWFDPVQRLGSTNWPVQGFIYPRRSGAKGAHGLSDDPIGAIIAAYQARSQAERTPTLRPVPKMPAGPTVVTSFIWPTSVSPRPHRRHAQLDQEQAF